MGSRHHSLEMTDVEDVAELLANFEQHNGIKLAIAVSVMPEGRERSLLLTACAFLLVPETGVALQLGSASVRCSGTKARSLGGALTQLLYSLDGELAKNEFGENGYPRA